VRQAGGRGAGGDFPNALTGGRSPWELLQNARKSLTSTQTELLAATFNAEMPLPDLIALSESHGGWPIAILNARYVLKRALRDGEGVNFAVVPDSPDLDRAPMPLYEAARMSSGDEEAFFEKYLLTNLDLCRDVAEFAAFSHALRAGALTVTPPPPPEPISAAPAPQLPTPTERPRVEAEPHDAPREKTPMRLVVVSVVAVVLSLMAIVAFLFGYFE
jgi:hypothetical protein